jgi:hypothetical protein
LPAAAEEEVAAAIINSAYYQLMHHADDSGLLAAVMHVCKKQAVARVRLVAAPFCSNSMITHS